MSSSRYSANTSRRRSRSPIHRRDDYNDQRNSSKRYEHSDSARRSDDKYNDRHYERRRDDYSRERRDDRKRDDYNNRRDDYYKREDRTTTAASAGGRGGGYEQQRNNNNHYEERRNYDRPSSYESRSHHYDSSSRPFYERPEDHQQHEPNINVVLRNLPDNAREVDIQTKLNSMEASIDDVALIKDRDTGESRKFAFIRFTSVGHAIQFVEKYRSFDMDSYRVRVDYCKKNKQDDETKAEEWRCRKCGVFNVISRRTCIDCKQSYMTAASNEVRTSETETIEINDGTKDISATPTHLLLLRKLDHLSTEESIFNAVNSLQGVHRALLIRDKMTKMSCEFAFVEFDSVQYAEMALEYARELLEIDGRRVSISYANQESFIPVYGQSEWSISAAGYDGLVAYWDKSSYASEYSLAIEQERKEKEQQEIKRKEEEELKRAKEKEKEAAAKKSSTLDDDVDAFFAEMGNFGTDTAVSDIFALPKAQ